MANKNAANIKNIKDLLYFGFDNERKNKVSLEITNFIEKKTVLTGFFVCLDLQSVLKIIIVILLE